MKLAPIYRAGKSVILSSKGKKSQALIRLEESKPLVQSVHLELPNFGNPRLQTEPLWANKRSRFKVFRPDRTILEDKGVSGGHFGARVVGFGGRNEAENKA